MKRPTLIGLFLLSSWASPAANICYFSLNNEKEFVEANKLTQKLNSFSQEKIHVHEYQTDGGEPEKSFRQMLESGATCDGLVISGHHTGSFGGKRAQGSLGIDFLERMSCDPRYEKFFSKVKAVWLQGCRTLGQEIVGDEEDNADFHRERVGEVLAEDHLEQGFAQLEMEFSDTLDQENPLSSRYLRVFPRATVFGWTRTAPGVGARSEFSLLYHLAHMGRLTDDRSEYFKNPLGGLREKTALHYAKTFLLLFERENILGPRCSRFYEQLAVDAWLFHGQAKTDDAGRPLPFSYNNPDLKAYSSLDASGNPLLKLAKEFGCDLKNPNLSYAELREILDKLLQDENLMGYNLNDLLGVVKRYEEKGGREWEDLRFFLKNNSKLTAFMGKKMNSPATGTLRKIDYYSLYRTLGMSKNIRERIEKKLLDSALVELTRQVRSHDFNRGDYIQTLAQSLIKHDILQPQHYGDLIERAQNKWILQSVASAVGRSKTPVANAREIFQQIIDSDKADGFALGAVAAGFRESTHPIKGGREILQKIVNSERAESFTLESVALTIGDSKHPITGTDEILQKIVDSPKAEDLTFVYVAKAIGNSKHVVRNAGEMMQTMVSSDKAGDFALGMIAKAIGNSRHPVEGAREILQKVVDSDKARDFALESVTRAIETSQYPIAEKEKLLEAVRRKKRGDGE